MIFPGVSPHGDLGLDDGYVALPVTVALTAGATVDVLPYLGDAYAQADIVADSAVDALPYLSPVGMHLTVATPAGATLSALELLCEQVATAEVQAAASLDVVETLGVSRKTQIAAGAGVSPLAPNYLPAKPAILSGAILSIFASRTISRQASLSAAAELSLVGGRYRHAAVRIEAGATLRAVTGRQQLRAPAISAGAVVSPVASKYAPATVALQGNASLAFLAMDEKATAVAIQAGASDGQQEVNPAVLGPELVTNWDFSSAGTGWTADSGWVVSTGYATASNVGPSSAFLYPDAVSTVIGRLYKATFVISEIVDGPCECYVWDGAHDVAEILDINSSGTYSALFTANSTDAHYPYIAAYDVTRLVVTSMSIKEVVSISAQPTVSPSGALGFPQSQVHVAAAAVVDASGSSVIEAVYEDLDIITVLRRNPQLHILSHE